MRQPRSQCGCTPGESKECAASFPKAKSVVVIDGEIVDVHSFDMTNGWRIFTTRCNHFDRDPLRYEGTRQVI